MSNAVLNPDPAATVTLRGVLIPLASDVGGAFISDCARNKERLVSDSRICERYGITPAAFAEIGANPAVRLAVSAEHDRRLLNGDAAREAAAKLFADAPHVLGQILNSESASPRHRIEAARELRTTANTGGERTGGPLRNDKETTLNLTEVLVRQGWLIPLKTHRKDRREWKIARGQLSG